MHNAAKGFSMKRAGSMDAKGIEMRGSSVPLVSGKTVNRKFRIVIDHQLIAIYTINLASVHLARGEPEAAEPLLREGLRIRALAPQLVPNRRRIFPEDDWTVGATKSLLGAALTALARYGEAETVLLEARRDLDAMSPPPRPDVDANITRLVDLYIAWGKQDEAARYRAVLRSSP